jgi:cobaltochelatase CobS
VVGPKGCGKSSSIRALAASIKQPLRRINLTNQTRVRDFVGYRTLDYEEEEGEIFQVINWVDGILPDAIRNNHWLLIDELDAAPPGVLFALQAVLEPERTLVLAENGGEVLMPPNEQAGRRFRIFATANTLGYGDDTGFYAGTNVMNMATLDRFAVMRMGYPKVEDEERIVASRTGGLSETVVKKMVAYAGKVREAVARDDCGITLSTRQLVQWGQMIVQIWANYDKTPDEFVFPSRDDPYNPCQHAIVLGHAMTVSGKLSDDDARFYAGIFQREFGFVSELTDGS